MGGVSRVAKRLGRVASIQRSEVSGGGAVVGGVVATTTSMMGMKSREEAGNAPTTKGRGGVGKPS